MSDHNEYMRTYIRNYRETHPEYYQKENERNKEKLKSRYLNDEEYRENKKRIAREYYHKKKLTVI